MKEGPLSQRPTGLHAGTFLFSKPVEHAVPAGLAGSQHTPLFSPSLSPGRVYLRRCTVGCRRGNHVPFPVEKWGMLAFFLMLAYLLFKGSLWLTEMDTRQTGCAPRTRDFLGFPRRLITGMIFLGLFLSYLAWRFGWGLG